MIKQFVEAFQSKEPELRAALSVKHPDSYDELVKLVVEMIADSQEIDDTPDPERITAICYGSYQGQVVYVIGETGYSPYIHWYVVVGYGSCSGCDTMEFIRSYSDDPPTEEQVSDYFTLCLHIVQGIKMMGSDDSIF